MAANCWGLSWGGTTGAWLTSWAAATTPAPVTDTGPTPAGRSKRRRYFLDIDGQSFEVADMQHARAIVDRAKDIARTHAQELAAKAVQTSRKVGKRPIALPTPTISSPDPELREIVQQARSAINAVYKQAALDGEIAALMARQIAEEDEEEALLLLM